ncbi:MAG: DUF2062 domain-containing protein [Spongiibacteraceae bacterium]
MARKLLKNWLPSPEKMRTHPSVRIFGSLLHDPNLWHLNRGSVTVAFFIGVFNAFFTITGQMLVAALLAIVFRANLPLSVMLVWITNPVTMPAIFYFSYKIGALLLDVPTKSFSFELSWHWVESELLLMWKPLLLGCTVNGLFIGLIGAASVHIMWRIHVIKRWRARQLKRLQATQDNNNEN